jgi:hypothetical protein
MSFSFHANTLAFGGQLDEAGSRQFLPSQASVTLPPEGGFGESSVTNYSENGVSFYRAESRVYGNSFDNRLFKTYASVTVYGLDIAGVVQADVLSASITSINERIAGCTAESRISFSANIVGLVIDGVPYDVQLDAAPFLEHGTFSEFTDSFASMNEDQVLVRAAAYNWPFDECRTLLRSLTGGEDQITYHVPQRCRTGLRATLVSDIVPSLRGGNAAPPLKRQGFTIEVPNLGVVHLGEVLLTTGRRGINLLRVELGKTLETAFVQQDSQPEPPPVGENRLHAVAAGETIEPIAADGGGTGGGYTVVHAVGNGTDFGPP